MHFYIIFQFLFLALKAVQSPASWIPFDTTTYKGYSQLQKKENNSIELFWSVDKSSDSIEFAIASNNGATWLALGTSDAGGMLGANIWMGRMASNGSFVLEERFTPVYGAPRLAVKQTLTLLNWTQTDQVTSFRFKRPLHGCDGEHTTITLDAPRWFIFAHGQSNTFMKHKDDARGQQIIDLSTTFFSDIPPIVLDSNTTTMSLISPPVNIKANESTTYCYTYYDFSSLGEKHQVIAENFTIGSKYTHHVLGYLCNRPLPQFKTPGTVLCNNYREKGQGDYVEFTNSCTSRPYFTWAKGGNARVYPSNMGKPIGPGPLNTLYMVVETHYANYHLEEGASDSGSGFVLTVTKNLRPVDIGMLTVGKHVRSLSLPPGGLVSSVNECGESCTRRWGVIPKTGLTITSTLHHMHKRGVALKIKHVRNGKEMPPLPSVDYFDFNFQTYLFAPPTQEKIFAGDRLIANCTYDTRTDTVPVPGGFSSEQEMCLGFIEYYPAVPLYTCVGFKLGKLPEVNFCPNYPMDLAAWQPYVKLPYTNWTNPDNTCSA